MAVLTSAPACPEGHGVWPALWLLPDDPYRYATTCFSDKREWLADEDCDAWPNSGEIDLMEHVGYEPGVVHGTVHSRDFYARTGNQVQGSVVVPDLGAAFHTYSLVWEEGALAMYIDGMRYFAYFNDGEGNGQWPFDHAFHIVMNLAIGGDWSGSYGPVEEGIMPRRLEVDFVRLYRRTADPARRTVHGGADTGIASAAWSPALSRPRSPLSHNRCAGPGQQ